jgi:hypothetical protein
MLLLEDRVHVAWQDRPFSGRIHKSALPQGLSCAEIVASVPDLNHRRFLEVGTVCINGEVVPREMWAFVRPKSRNDVYVTLHMPLHGGGSGKDTFRIIAVIALLVVATAITSGAAASLFPETGLFLAGSVSAQVLAGAVSLGGALLLGAFVKPPAQIEQKRDSDEGDVASLGGNELRRGAPIARVVGTHRVFPPFLAQPLIDLQDYDEVIEGVYGLAGPHRLRDIKFGNVYLDDVDPEQIDYQFYELSDDDTGLDDQTQLYVKMNGAQDAVAFNDSSTYVRPVVASDNENVFTDQRLGFIGNSATFFNGDAHLSITHVPDFVLGVKDWSIDVFEEWESSPGLFGYIAGQASSGFDPAASSWTLALNTSGLLEATVYDGSGATTLTSTASIAHGRHHVAFARQGNTLCLWVDGIVQATAAFSGYIPSANPSTLDIAGSGGGNAPSPTTRWIGWLNNFRFQVGSSWYTVGVNFTPPEIHYKPDEPSLIERYGKTQNLQLQLSEHRIANEQSVQSTRDTLANQSVPARSLPQAQSVVARGRGFDEVWVTLTLPSGLFYQDTNFEEDWFYGLPIRIRVRELGAAEDAWVQLPEIHIHDRRTARFSRMIVFRWDSDLAMPNGVLNTTPPTQKGWIAAYYSVPVQTQNPAGTGGWTAASHFYAGTGDTYLAGGTDPEGEFGGADPDAVEHNVATTGVRYTRLSTEKAEFFLDGLVPKGPIEIELRRGQLYTADKFRYSTYVLTTNPPSDGLADDVFDLFGYTILSGKPVIILKKSNAADIIGVSRVATVFNRAPIARKGQFAAIYMRAVGRSLEALSVVASGLVPDWDGENWSGLHATSNPAPHYRDVLIGTLNDNRIPVELLNDETLLEWRTRCADLEFECNAVFSGERVDRVLETIAGCGYARPRQSELWDVAQDRDFSSITPVQMFNPRNMRNFRWEKAFIRHRPDGLRVRYNDATDDYNERTIVVPKLGNVVGETGRLEEIKYEGVVTETEAVLRAIYDQQQVVDRFTFYNGEVDAEMLVCRRGDLVLVQHDIVDHFAGFSRVLTVASEDGSVTSLELDGSVSAIDAFFNDDTFFDVPTQFFTSNVGVVVRRKNGQMVSFEAEVSDDGFTLTPTSPISDEDIERECLVSTGKLLRASRRMLVYNIRAKANLTADVTFVDEAPQLWQFPEPIEAGEDFMRNRFVNGDMRYAQRGTSFSIAADSVRTWALDRWFGQSTVGGGTFTITQEDDSPPSGFDNYLRATVATASSPISGSHIVGTTLRGRDLQGFDWGRGTGKTAALSFNVRASVTGVYYGTIRLTNSPHLSYPFTFTVPLANTWARRIVTITPPLFSGFAFDPTAHIFFELSLGGADDDTTSLQEWQAGDFSRGTTDNGIMTTLGATLDITGLQFEPGAATQYEWLPDAVQLDLCRRYLQVFENDAPATIMVLGSGVAITTTDARIMMPLSTPMITAPRIVVEPDLTGLHVRNGAVNNEISSILPDQTSLTEPGVLGLSVSLGSNPSPLLLPGEALVLRLSGTRLLLDCEVT